MVVTEKLYSRLKIKLVVGRDGGTLENKIEALGGNYTQENFSCFRNHFIVLRTTQLWDNGLWKFPAIEYLAAESKLMPFKNVTKWIPTLVRNS